MSSTPTAGDGTTEPGKKWRATVGAAAELRWSKLPEDLLSMVYCRLTSPVDRVRFAAVGKPWRAFVSRSPPPPAPPLLLLSPRDGDHDKHMYCLEDGGVLRVSLPSKAIGKWFVGSHDGGWISAADGSFMIFNIFSGVEVELSTKQRRVVCTCPERPVVHKSDYVTGPFAIWKIVFSEAPTSSTCILAAITDRCRVALCRVGSPDGGWTTEGCGSQEKLRDIAFCRGELYGLARFNDILLKFDVDVNGDGAPVVTAAHKLSIQELGVPRWHDQTKSVTYIVELRGKMAMAVRTGWSPNLEPFFRVFELVDANTGGAIAPYKYKWAEVTSLGDNALFLGTAFSKAVSVPAVGRGGVQRNRIYYSNHHNFRQGVLPADAVYLTSTAGGDAVYCREDEGAGDGAKTITWRGYYVRDGVHDAMWLALAD